MKRSARRGNFLNAMLSFAVVVAILLLSLLPGVTLIMLGWHYLGGASEVEKIHPATYMLFLLLPALTALDPEFRERAFRTLLRDHAFASFAFAVSATAIYAIVDKGASIAPFVDTFGSTIVVTLIMIVMRKRFLILLRNIFDLFFVINIVIIFIEYALKQNILYTNEAIYTNTGEFVTVFRACGLFGHPLAAAGLLGMYAIINLVMTPMRLRAASIARLMLSLTSFMAIFATGGRAALVITGAIFVAYVTVCAIRALIIDKINPVGIMFTIMAVVGTIIVVPVMWQLGFFDLTLNRFEHDYGSTFKSRNCLADRFINATAGPLVGTFAQQCRFYAAGSRPYRN